MAIGKKRKEAMAKKKQRKEEAMKRPDGASNYARKRAYLITNGGWGFDYVTKPWK